ncbi:autotransporter-associated beta strand repeat-containing protein [Haloferula sp. BvORR071]|uniref:beta strand repeat-containing protein n=1 Tax=Haloferula sp. BvORR071 TaxID=1396141 RepID=UPI000555CF19|nr:autotransporter-associated beta strand repeat-containing protein [Haloferula sp. BvORR071]
MLAAAVSPAWSATTWNNSSADSLWSTPANWNGGEPDANTDAFLLASPGGTITLAAAESARSLQVAGDYTLRGGSLNLSASNVVIQGGRSVSIGSTLSSPSVLMLLGGGSLVLQGSNTIPGASVGASSSLRLTHPGALGSTGTSAVSGRLELEGITLQRPLQLLNGGTLAGIGNVATTENVTIDPAAALVNIDSISAGEVFTLGNGLGDLSGGSTTTQIEIGGAGKVRIPFPTTYAGSWYVSGGAHLEVERAQCLGTATGASLTLHDATLITRGSSSTGNFTTGPGNHLILAGDASEIIADGGANYMSIDPQFGEVSIGFHTLHVHPYPPPNGSYSNVKFGPVTLTGNPVFAVGNQSLGPQATLTLGALAGGASPRSITKTGSGNLTFSAAATSLAAGSSFAASGGGDVSLIFPNLGAASTVTVSAVQHPLGSSTITMTDSTLRFRTSGSGTSAAQTFIVPNAISLAGNAGLAADPNGVNEANKTLELPSVTLAPGATMHVAGGNSSGYGFRLPNPLLLQGDATLSGNADIYSTGGLILNGGVSGGPTSKLSITEGSVSTLGLSINGSSSYGGGTTISGSRVVLNAPAALGSGPVLLTGGTLTVNQGTTIPGGLSVQGGYLVVRDLNALAGLPLTASGGRLSVDSSANVTVPVGALTLNGSFDLGVDNGHPNFSALFSFPSLHVAGNSTLTASVNQSSGNAVPQFDSVSLAGDITFDLSGLKLHAVTEDGQPRKVIKKGYLLTLDGANSYSGGTDVMKGLLSVTHSGGLGSGPLTLYSTNEGGTTAASFSPGLTIANPLVTKNGGGNDIAIELSQGSLIWNGNISLEDDLIFRSTATNAITTITGVISGPGTLHTAGEGQVVLTNASNSFGSGGPASVLIDNGSRLGIASDAMLGNPANGVTLLQGARLGIDGSFASARKITLSGGNTQIDVAAGKELSLLSPLAGAERLWKTGNGTLSIAPGVDNSGRGSAPTYLYSGTVRLQSPQNLSATGPVQLYGTSTTTACLDLAADAATNFGTTIESGGWGTVHVDRAPGGSGSGGIHEIAKVTGRDGTLNVTGDHGYGLRVNQVQLTGGGTFNNNNTVPLELAAVGATSSLSFGGSGDIEIPSMVGSSGSALFKTGAGTVQLGPTLNGFKDGIAVRDGTLDMSGLNHAANYLEFGGAESVLGPKLSMGASGMLTLANDISWKNAGGTAAGLFSGKLDLGGVAHNVSVGTHNILPYGLTIDGTISGSAGCSLIKTGAGTLRLTGNTSNTEPGLVTVSQGGLQLAKTSGDAIGSGGLTLRPNIGSPQTGFVVSVGSQQIHDSAAVTVDSTFQATVDLAGFTETIGNLTITQAHSSQSSSGAIVRTGANGILVMNGNISLNNNFSSPQLFNERRVVITGSGTITGFSTSDGTLDLGGAARTIRVATTVTDGNVDRCDASIETKIINGSIIKTGPRRLYLTNPANSFAGGIQINEGIVRAAGGGNCLGNGPVVLANAAGVAAGIDFNSNFPSSPVPNNITIGGAGTSGLSYSGPVFSTLELSGGITLQKTLAVEVTNGTTSKTRTATLALSGTINDGASTFALQKTGDGRLKLAAGNSYSGATVIKRGFLEIADPSSLGDGNLPLSIDGGCLLTTTPLALARNVAFTVNGGAIRSDAVDGTTFSGSLDWGSGASACFGTGATIVTGSTSGTGSLLLGFPTNFASTTSVQVADHGTGHRLALRGSASLPAGKLGFDRGAVLELGNADFTRSLGTGAGQFEIASDIGGGWAAYGADRTVSVGGAGTALTWGQAAPAFLNKSGTVGGLYLGSSSGTHTLTLANGLELHNGAAAASQLCKLFVNDGPAAIDAKLAGNLTVTDPLKSATLEINGAGALELAAENSGAITVIQKGAGTTRFTSERFAIMSLEQGKWLFLDGPGSTLTAIQSLTVAAGSQLDVSGSVEDLGILGTGALKVDGTITGSIRAPELTEGHGLIEGSVTLPAGILKPTTGGTLQITGALTLGANLKWNGQGPLAGSQHPQVKVDAGISIAPGSHFDVSAASGFALGQSYLVLLNGAGPISGTFQDLPEGALIPLPGGALALQVTYQANGDGQATGNDFGFTVVADPGASDRTLGVAGPVAVGFGEEIALTYTLGNAGPAAVTGAIFEGIVPAGANLLGSTPAGTLNQQTLTVPLSDMPAGGNATVTIRFQAGNQRGALATGGTFKGTSADPDGSDPMVTRVVAILPGGANGKLALSGFSQSSSGNRVDLSIETITGVKYRVEGSADLSNWTALEEFVGTGGSMTRPMPVDAWKKFFRIRIVP